MANVLDIGALDQSMAPNSYITLPVHQKNKQNFNDSFLFIQCCVASRGVISTFQKTIQGRTIAMCLFDKFNNTMWIIISNGTGETEFYDITWFH